MNFRPQLVHLCCGLLGPLFRLRYEELALVTVRERHLEVEARGGGAIYLPVKGVPDAFQEEDREDVIPVI